jgi:PhnB protein
MQTKLNAYLSFKDNAREAMEFYQSIFGGNLVMSTFKDFQASTDPSEDHKIMHAVLETEDGFSFMASDTLKSREHRPGTNFSLALSGDNEAELKTNFQKLSEGGLVSMPLHKEAWGDYFGMCTDKFGVNWMVNISPLKV